MNRNLLRRRAVAGTAIAALALVAACADGSDDPTGGDGGSGLSGQIAGAGATFPTPLWQSLIDDYTRNVEPGIRINYQSIGSGGGITQFKEQTVDWGSSERFLSDTDLVEAEASRGCAAFQVPIVYGSVVITFGDDQFDGLVLDAETIALIYDRQITNYNDPRIAGLNPDRELPDLDIIPVHRSDGSGTTNVFTLYLSDEVPMWASKYGAGTEVDWAAGTIGGQGNEGVAANTQQNPGGIGYVNQSYALELGMPQAQVINADGNSVYPTLAATTAGLANLDIDDTYQFSILGIGGEGYPITGAVWNFFWECGYDDNTAELLKAFWTWALTDGDQHVTDLHYAPLDDDLKQRVIAELDRINVNN